MRLLFLSIEFFFTRFRLEKISLLIVFTTVTTSLNNNNVNARDMFINGVLHFKLLEL